MRNRASKRLGLMLAAAFALMPLPSMWNEKAMGAGNSTTHSMSVAATHLPVNRAGVAINGVMKDAIDPVQMYGLYYVPFNQIARLLGYSDVRYNYRTKTSSATDGSVTVRITVGGTRAMKGDELLLVHAPRYVNGTTYISLDTVSRLFNTFTYFKPQNGSIQIDKPARSYKVQAGDTVWLVAQAHHTTVTALREANGLRTDWLSVGQILRLPPESKTKEMEPVRFSHSIPAHNFTQVPAKPVQTNTGTSVAQAVIRTGEQYMGVPYVFGARTSQAPRVFDCSSFVQYVFKVQGISLPRDSRQQSACGTQVSKANLKPGDLLFFKYPEMYSDGRVGHVGIYIGNGKMLHTIPKTGVTITTYVKSRYWTNNFLFAKRVIH